MVLYVFPFVAVAGSITTFDFEISRGTEIEFVEISPTVNDCRDIHAVINLVEKGSSAEIIDVTLEEGFISRGDQSNAYIRYDKPIKMTNDGAIRFAVLAQYGTDVLVKAIIKTKEMK